MRIGFAGTPAFAQLALERILQAGWPVAVVLTQPDRPAGRGLQLTTSAVKVTALEHGIEVLQPRSLRLDGRHGEDAQHTQARLAALSLDVLVVAAYGLILPAWTLALPTKGCLNIHASLLPRWRGAAPIQRAIEAGDSETGITIMQMDEGLDTGDILLTERLPIQETDTGQTLHDKLAAMGAALIVRALHALQDGELQPQTQPLQGVTYALKLQKSESLLDCQQPAAELARRVRAFDPFPGTTVVLPGLSEPVKVWQAQAHPMQGHPTPGAVLRADADGIDLATAQGVLRLLELQKPGGKRQTAKVFLQGNTVRVGP